MGLDANFHLGIYLLVPCEEREVQKDFYLDHETGEATPHKFNPRTGKPNTVDTITIKEVPNIDPSIGYKYDNFFKSEFLNLFDGYEILIHDDNQNLYYADKNGNRKAVDFDGDFVMNLNKLEPHKLKKIIYQFEQDNKQYLEELRALYGNVETCFGLVKYYA